MKKQILKTLTLLGLICSTNLLAVTLEEYKEIVDSYKIVDTSDKELSQTFRVNGKKIIISIYKKNDGFKNNEWQEEEHLVTINNNTLPLLNSGNNITIYEQTLFAINCISKDEKIILSTVVKSSFNDKMKKKIHYGGLISKLDENYHRGYSNLDEIEILKTGAYTQIPTYNPKEFYPYYNEEKILNRLYETGTCDKELTQKANIEVLVGDKWIAQEQSWNIKKEEISNTIQLNLNEVLKNLKEKKETNLSIENLNEILKNEELNQKTVQKYNDIAYYLQQKNVNNEAIFLLEKIIEKFPNRIVAYLNLADAYDGLGNKEKAKKNYGKYINLMKQDNKEVKIPKRVLEYK